MIQRFHLVSRIGLVVFFFFACSSSSVFVHRLLRNILQELCKPKHLPAELRYLLQRLSFCACALPLHRRRKAKRLK